jgi:hypothetical protein
MKVKKELKILILSVFFLGSFSAFGQCDTDIFLDECAHGLGTYNYIKSFSIKASSHKKSNPEYSYVFSKGSTYMLIVCDQNLIGGKMILKLYDREHNLIASTFDEKDHKYYTDLRYSCEATGVYYIQASFEGSKGGCGMCILGFNKE